MSQPPDALATALVNRYRIEKELGAGGMATVFLATDLRHSRQVALKVLKPELASHVGVERFQAEIATTARLRHPHILPLFDSGEAADLLYYVMPLVEGESLRDRMQREGRIPVDDALRITREVGDALAYAHDQGVVHRDIKPENILLERSHAQVADFGIARAIAGQDDTRLTHAGLAVGTVAYMSPEQASGEDIDGRADLYSLACVLFEMITGEPPFSGATAEAILVQRFTQAPPRVTQRHRSVPVQVEQALLKAMDRQPDRRFGTLTAFAEALASPVMRPAEREKAIAVLPFANMSGADDEHLGDGISEEIINALSQLPGLRVAARTSSFAFRNVTGDLREVGEKLSVSMVLEGSVRRAGQRLRVTAQLIDVADGYHLWSERYDREMTDIFTIQDEIAGAVATKLMGTLEGEGIRLPGRAGTSNLEAYELFLKGRQLSARRGPALRPAASCLEQAVALDPGFAEAQAFLADAYILIAMYGQTLPAEFIRRSRAAAERGLASDPTSSHAHYVKAQIQVSIDWNLEEGARTWARSLELDPRNSLSRANRALWLYGLATGDWDRAAADFRIAIEQDPLNATLHALFGIVLCEPPHHDEAIAETQRAIDLDRESFIGWWIHVHALGLAGRVDEAVAAADVVLGMSGRHPFVLVELGCALARNGQVEKAEAILEELIARGRSQFIAPAYLSILYSLVGRMDEAMRSLEAGIAAQEAMTAAVLNMHYAEPVRRHPDFARIVGPLLGRGARSRA